MLPHISIIGYVLYVVAIFIVSDLKIIFTSSVIFFFLMVFLPYRKLRTGIIPVSLFLSATFFANLLFIPGKIVFMMGPVTITEEGLYLASLRALRVFLLIAGAKFITIISSLEDVITSMGQLLSPLEKMGFPVKRFFKTMSLSVRMLPLIKQRLSEEYSKRIGSDTKRGLRERASVVFRFILPVFFESIHDPESFLKNGHVRYHEGDETGHR